MLHYPFFIRSLKIVLFLLSIPITSSVFLLIILLFSITYIIFFLFSTNKKNLILITDAIQGLTNVTTNNKSDTIPLIVKRIFWESPQTLLGCLFFIVYLFTNKVDSIYYYDEATLIKLRASSKKSIGYCLGCFIFSQNIAPSPSDALFVHEYGHYLQSKHYGIAYCFLIALPSSCSFYFNTYQVHRNKPFEKNANQRSLEFFNEKSDFDKDSFLSFFPI